MKKNKILTMILSIGIIIAVIGVSYAFFAYGKTGLYTHTINGGKMNVIYDEVTGNSITIDNAYPLTDEEALTDSMEFEFTVTGYNESDKNIYYQIEMDYGENVTDKNRFLDSDMKLTLFENDELVLENKVFDNLDNQGIYYGYISYGTSKESPTVNNYKLRIWINDNVFITNTPNEYDTEGKSIYSTSDFANSYASYKVNVIANLTGEDIGMLFYDANGGEFSVKSTSLSNNKITVQKPVLENKAFLGWSSNPTDIEVEYQAGQYYSGPGKTLYAIYNDTKNVMVDEWPDEIKNNLKSFITGVYFINEKQSIIDEKAMADLTLNNQGSVKCWIEDVYNQNYDDYMPILYIASEGTIYLTDCSEMFMDWTALEFVDFTNVDTSMVEDMSYMFAMSNQNNYSFPMSNFKNAKNELSNQNLMEEDILLINCGPEMVDYNFLTYLDLTPFNTKNVKDMSYMFYAISSNDSCGKHGRVFLEKIDLSSFDTSNVENMEGMFFGQYSLKELDVTNFNTSKVKTMAGMFTSAGNFSKLDLSNFDTSQVVDMSYMFAQFQYENQLTSINISSFDTSNVKSMFGMFMECNNINELNISHLNTSQVIDMGYMFYNCNKLKGLDLRNFNTSNVIDMSYMFCYCYELYNLDVSSFITNNVTNMSSMFDWCESLSNLNVSNFDTSKVTDMSYMFAGLEVTSLDVGNFNTSNVTDMSYMFSNSWQLKELKLSNFDTSNVTNMSYMFNSCTKLEYLDISNFDFTNIDSFDWCFNDVGYVLGTGNYTEVLAKDETARNWILGLNGNHRPSGWSVNNISIKNA